MTDDFHTESARKRLAYLDAQRQQTLANLAISKNDNDYESAAEEIQTIANIDAQRTNLINLHRQYEESQRPAQQVPQTREEWKTKAIERMTLEDGLEVARESKYGKILTGMIPVFSADIRRCCAAGAGVNNDAV
jgi:hypothetical protein